MCFHIILCYDLTESVGSREHWLCGISRRRNEFLLSSIVLFCLINKYITMRWNWQFLYTLFFHCFFCSCFHPCCRLRICTEVSWWRSQNGERCIPFSQRERSSHHLHWWDWCHSNKKIWCTNRRWDIFPPYEPYLSVNLGIVPVRCSSFFEMITHLKLEIRMVW